MWSFPFNYNYTYNLFPKTFFLNLQSSQYLNEKKKRPTRVETLNGTENVRRCTQRYQQ